MGTVNDSKESPSHPPSVTLREFIRNCRRWLKQNFMPKFSVSIH